MGYKLLHLELDSKVVLSWLTNYNVNIKHKNLSQSQCYPGPCGNYKHTDLKKTLKILIFFSYRRYFLVMLYVSEKEYNFIEFQQDKMKFVHDYACNWISFPEVII